MLICEFDLDLLLNEEEALIRQMREFDEELDVELMERIRNKKHFVVVVVVEEEN